MVPQGGEHRERVKGIEVGEQHLSLLTQTEGQESRVDHVVGVCGVSGDQQSHHRKQDGESP